MNSRGALTVACAFSLVAAVTLLVPGPGLSTIPIPDNGPGTVLGLADYPNFGKRNTDPFSRLLLGFISPEPRQAETPTALSDITPRYAREGHLAPVSDLGIRAPPAG